MIALNKAFGKPSWILLWISLGFFILQWKLVSSLKPQFERSELIEYLREDTNVADEVLVGYDKRFIPTIQGEPLQVRLQVVISDILNIGNMEAEMMVFIRQTWYDYRLTWNSTRRLKIREHFLDKIWVPDVRIINLKEAKRFEGFGGVNMNIYPDGRIYFSQLVHVKTSCPMDLHKFPMDRQTCFLNFSSFAYGKSLLNFSTTGKEVQVRQHELTQFDLIQAREFEEDSKSVMSKLTVALTFQRRAGYYILQVYIPASFLVILSWLSFFMEASNIADRLALEITMILSTVFLLDGINDSVIHVSYAKASDWFVIVSFGFIFVALLETMFVYRLSILEGRKRSKSAGVTSALEKQLSVIFLKTEEEAQMAEEDKLKQAMEPDELAGYRTESDITINKNERKFKNCCSRSCSASHWIDKCCFVLFPLMYIAFNIGYWMYYLP